MSFRGAQLQSDAVGPDAPLTSSCQVRKPKSRAWIWLLCLVAIAAGMQWLRRDHSAHKQAPIVAIRSAKSHAGSLEKTLRLTGMTVAEKAAILSAPLLLGRRSDGDYSQILKELVPNGSFVKKGDVVAEFDRQFMEIHLDDYDAVVAQNERYVKMLAAQFDVIRTSQNRKVAQAKGAWDKALLNLKTAPVRSVIQIEKFRLAAEEARSRYDEYSVQSLYLDDSEGSAKRSAELNLRRWRLLRKMIANNVQKMRVRTPVDGLVVMSTVQRGLENVVLDTGDRMSPGQVLMQVVDTRSLVVDAAVNQADAKSLKIGQKAKIHVDAFPDVELRAHVVSIGAFSKVGAYRRNFLSEIPVRLRFDDSDPRVIPNFSASADVVLDAKENVTLIEKECVFDDPDSRKHIAYVRHPEGWERREVEIGLQNNTEAEVTSGVRAGEELAAEPVPASSIRPF